MKTLNKALVSILLAVIVGLLLFILFVSVDKHKTQKEAARDRFELQMDSMNRSMKEKLKWAQIRIGSENEIQDAYILGDTIYFILVPDTIKRSLHGN